MGVAGSGKTTVGLALARELGSRFLDADAFHPEENIAKMASGIPLTDKDREPWLDSLAGKLAAVRAEGASFVLACSALKESYRERLMRQAPDLKVVFLDGTAALIHQRISTRNGHFMPPILLQSQFEALEIPQTAIRLDVEAPVAVLVSRILEAMNLRS